MVISKIIQYCFSRWRHKGKAFFPYGAIVSQDAICEGGNKIGKGSVFSGKIGLCSYIGTDCHFSGEIGRFSSVAQNCNVLSGRHSYTYPYVSTSPAFYSLRKQTSIVLTDKQKFYEQKYADEKNKIMVKIGNDCWINSDVKIISGVTISDGAVVLAGSVVTKDVPPYAIVGGVPARVLKYRYSSEDIELLLSSQWWNNDLSWIKEHASAFCDFQQFKSILSKQ